MYCCLFFQFRYKLGHVSAFWRIYDKFILFFCWLVQHGWIYTCSQLSRQQATSNSTRDGRLASSRVIYSQCLPGWTERKDNVTKYKSRPSRICIKQKETYIYSPGDETDSVRHVRGPAFAVLKLTGRYTLSACSGQKISSVYQAEEAEATGCRLGWKFIEVCLTFPDRIIALQYAIDFFDVFDEHS